MFTFEHKQRPMLAGFETLETLTMESLFLKYDSDEPRSRNVQIVLTNKTLKWKSNFFYQEGNDSFLTNSIKSKKRLHEKLKRMYRKRRSVFVV